MSDKIYQIKITLKGSKPPIWRRILVESDMLLSDFHKILQTTMGWLGGHLHEFVEGNKSYRSRLDDDDFWDSSVDVDYNKKGTRIRTLLKKIGDKIIYEYDFGDGWQHTILLEEILPVDPEKVYPICIAGKMKCPPEDVGGIYGYEDILEVLKDPDNERYEEMIDWVGDDFDPKHFDKDEVNELLMQDDFGFIDLVINWD